MSDNEKKHIGKICFIAPSSRLDASDAPTLHRTARLLKKTFGARAVYLSPFLFSSDELIKHVTASVAERSKEFKAVIRDFDLIASVAGGTGAEDLALGIDKSDFEVIRNRRPLFIGFSDFTFLLNEIYFKCRIPSILFPSLRLTRGNCQKMLSLVSGEDVPSHGSFWLTAPPARQISGIPIGGNFTTFVNWLNREHPPKVNWKKHILFIEDIQIDVEDLHRLVAALRRHKMIKRIRGLVIGSLCEEKASAKGREFQRKALSFFKAYLAEILKRRQKQGFPLPILVSSNFGHNITRNLPTIPIGGYVSIAKSKKMIFRLAKKRESAPWILVEKTSEIK
jgi:muramoyltetrapeptide carboxypeptidase LdcA involved in peptidoglycan recycling